MKIYMRVSAFIRICPRRDIGVLCCPSYMAWWSKHPISGDGLIPWQMWRTEYQARRAIVEYSGKEMLFEDMGRIRHHGSRLEPREQFQAPDDFLQCHAVLYRPGPRHIPSTYLVFVLSTQIACLVMIVPLPRGWKCCPGAVDNVLCHGTCG